MGFNIEKLRQMAKPSSQESMGKAKFRKENAKWIRMSQDIALTIAYYLRNNKITQKELAEKLGVSPAYVGKLLKGQENLTLETISKIQCAIDEEIVNIAKPYMTQQLICSISPIRASVNTNNMVNSVTYKVVEKFSNNSFSRKENVA